MNERIVVLIGALLVTPGQPAQQNVTSSYLCIPDYSTGFSNSSGRWTPTQFTVEGKKYLLANRRGRWVWSEFGQQQDSVMTALAAKLNTCDTFSSNGFLNCEFWFEEVRFNRETLRFQVVEPNGYVVAKAALDDSGKSGTPFIQIGTCSVLQ
jgi:hypothetical protein